MVNKKALGPYMKYDLRLLRPQCTMCNFRYEGMGAHFAYNMIKREGQEYVDKIISDCKIEVRAEEFYPGLLSSYQSILNEESKTRG